MDRRKYMRRDDAYDAALGIFSDHGDGIRKILHGFKSPRYVLGWCRIAELPEQH